MVLKMLIMEKFEKSKKKKIIITWESHCLKIAASMPSWSLWNYSELPVKWPADSASLCFASCIWFWDAES